MTTLLNDVSADSYTQCYDLDEVEITPDSFSHIYKELRRIAHRQLSKSWSMETISTTVLVNEAYLKLFKNTIKTKDKAHFLSVAATAMRHILINYAEQKSAAKRGGEWLKITFDEALAGTTNNLENLLLVNEALKKMKEIDPQLTHLIEMRFFAGMTEGEIAAATNLSERSVRRNWKKAKALVGQLMLEQK